MTDQILKFKHELFVGKVVDEMGLDKTLQLLKEVNDVAEHFKDAINGDSKVDFSGKPKPLKTDNKQYKNIDEIMDVLEEFHKYSCRKHKRG